MSPYLFFCTTNESSYRAKRKHLRRWALLETLRVSVLNYFHAGLSLQLQNFHCSHFDIQHYALALCIVRNFLIITAGGWLDNWLQTAASTLDLHNGCRCACWGITFPLRCGIWKGERKLLDMEGCWDVIVFTSITAEIQGPDSFHIHRGPVCNTSECELIAQPFLSLSSIPLLPIILTQVYCLMCVLSQYQEYKAGRGMRKASFVTVRNG